MNTSHDAMLIGNSPPMTALRMRIESAARTQLPVLIEGPTGSGKELVATELHVRSGRAGRLVAFNVCAVSDSMFEDALFGHVRGAFTGAFGDRQGFLREAHGGTVFLDEIGGLSLTLQAKLLRAIETKEFRPVGAAHDARTDAWVIAATNEPMAGLTTTGRIRDDLAYRLTGIVIRVPSLDERREDIPQLVRHFLRCAGYPDAPLDSGVTAHLQRQPWGGNVRELRQIVEWSAALSDGRLTRRVVEQTLADRITPFAAATTHHPERNELEDLLMRHDWNTDTAARELGIHRATLYRRMKRHRLSVPQPLPLVSGVS